MYCNASDDLLADVKGPAKSVMIGQVWPTAHQIWNGRCGRSRRRLINKVDTAMQPIILQISYEQGYFALKYIWITIAKSSKSLQSEGGDLAGDSSLRMRRE